MARPRKPRKLNTVGQLRPECIYNSDGLLRFAGIGGSKLREARKAGVKSKAIGNRMFYRGKDIINWIFGELREPQGSADEPTAQNCDFRELNGKVNP